MFVLLDLLPMPIREPIFKLSFRAYGRMNNIDYGCYFRYPRKISIGDHVWINRNCRFYASHYIPDAMIILGSHIAIGPEVTFFSAGHDHCVLDLPDTAQSIRVGDYAWIGGRSIILPGVVIGEGAIVGAGSVVTKSVEPYTIVGGNPAVFIKRRVIK